MDTLFIRQLQLHTVIGVYDWERQCEQTLYLDLDLAVDIRPAAASDALEHTLNYAALADEVIALAKHTRVALIETLAERIAQHIQAQYGVPWLRLALHKPGAVAAAQTLGVEIIRGTRPA